MTHTESSTKVYFTKEYGKFKTINGNRQLNEQKIKRIKKDIQNGLNVLMYCPIIVSEKNERLEIIDGQHRFYVAKQLGSVVWYIVANEMSLMDIATINSNTDKWKDADFINCYIQQGNEHYEVLQKFIDETGFPLGISLKLLTNGIVTADGAGSSNFKRSFHEGRFEVKELEKAYEIVEKVKMFSDFTQHKSGSFIEAICRIIKAGKINLADLYIKFSANPKLVTPQRNGKEYLNNLEQVYNQNVKIRKIIW
jgi:hypothetical protein